MGNAEYWRGRFSILEEAAQKEADHCFSNIEDMFKEAERTVQADLERWYGRFAANNQISLTEARKMLIDGQLEEFKWTVDQYIETAQKANLSEAWIKKLENASTRFHVSRLESVQLQIQQQIELLYGNQTDSIDDLLRKIVSNGYTQTAYEVQKGIGIGWDITALNSKKIETLLSTPWTADNKTFRDRCWENKANLVTGIQKNLTQGLLRGDSPQKITDAVKKQFGVSRYQAGRLVHTETTYFNAAASYESYKELGVDMVEIIETLDSHTCELCQPLDGTKIPLSQYEPGVTVPPFHPNCRGTTAPAIDEEIIGKRAARDNEGKVYNVPSNMKYGEWKAEFLKQEQEAKVKRIKDAQELFSAMENVGLMRLPSLDEFAEMKYNNSPNYQKLLKRYQNLTGEREWSAVEFNPETVKDHFNRHGSGLNLGNVSEYEKAALRFVNRTADKEVLISEDGVRRFFRESDGFFASVYPDGTISTFYIPKTPKKYWEGQVKKYGGTK